MKEAGIIKEEDKLTTEESELLENYNKLSDSDKESFLKLIQKLADEGSADGKNE